jgi:fructose-1,6-bisphosphatase class II
MIPADLPLEFVRVVERAAIESARTMGRGDRKGSDGVAVEAMRHEMETVDIDGTIVIGEGERDEAPMLYIGEKVGTGTGPAVDIAVDPLEGTNLCATGAAGAIAVLAAAERGGLLHAPDIYMDKLVIPGPARGQLDIAAPVEDNLKALARALNRDVDDLVVVVLDRPRHETLIADIRKAGARIRLIGDGDLSAAISVAVLGTGVHAVMGIGGAPEGVLSAAAMRCLNGEIQGRLVMTRPADADRMRRMGISDLERVYRTEDLAPGKSIIFAAGGVTEGPLLKAVRFFRDGIRTECLVMTTDPHQVRFIDTIHAEPSPDVVIRF